MSVNWKTRLLSKKTIAKDIVEMRLQKPDGFSYTAGQFVQFKIPDGEKTVLRAYSIASHPAEETLEFCIKMLPSGRASAFFMNATPETAIVFQGPNGKFTCAAIDTPLSFVATSAGIAPVWGIIVDELINKKNIQPIQLVFGVRSEDDIFWTDRLADLASRFSTFQFFLVFSQPKRVWEGKTGRVTEHLEALPTTSHFFLCGNVEMVKDVRAALLAKDIPPSNVHFEIF